MATHEALALDGCGEHTPGLPVDRLVRTRERTAGPDAVRIAALFKLLGDPNRCRILYALLDAGELCVCDLARVVGTPESSVSHALRLLRTAGVVAGRRDGRMVRYRLADAHTRTLLDLSREHVDHQPREG